MSTRWHSRLMHCATCRTDAGSITDDVIRNFSLKYSFRLLHGPGFDSASDIHKYQEYFLEDKGGRCVRLTNLAFSCADCLWKSWAVNLLGTSGSLEACTEIVYMFVPLK